MAIRANGLKNFKGQSYATTVDVAESIAALKQQGKELFLSSLMGTGTGSDANKLAMYNSDGVFQSTGYGIGVTTDTDFGGSNKLATEEGVAAYISANSAPLISEGNNIFFTEITGTGDYAGKTLKGINAFGYKLVKRMNAVDGYAASYDLQISDANGDYATVTGSDPINIVKDQFLKSAYLVWGSSADLTNGVPADESNTKTSTAKYPFLKLELFVNDNSSSSDDVLTTTVYLPVNDLFRDYTAEANATQIQVAISNDNEISATVVAGSITTTELSTGVNTSLGLADTAIQVGDVNRLLYTPQGESQTNVGAYLDTLTDKVEDVKDIFYGKAVEFVDVTVTLNGNNVTDANGCASSITSGVVTMTVPGKVICVYDGEGNQIYPDIKFAKATGVSTLKADFGTETPDTTWDVTYSRIITVESSSSANA